MGKVEVPGRRRQKGSQAAIKTQDVPGLCAFTSVWVMSMAAACLLGGRTTLGARLPPRLHSSVEQTNKHTTGREQLPRRRAKDSTTTATSAEPRACV